MVAILDEGSFQWMIHQTEGQVLGWLEENGLDWSSLLVCISGTEGERKSTVSICPFLSPPNALTIVTPYNNSCDTTANLAKQNRIPNIYLN